MATNNIRMLCRSVVLLLSVSFASISALASPYAVLVMNVHGMGADQTWTQNGQDIISYISASGADIVALQELSAGALTQIQDVNSGLGALYDIYSSAGGSPVLIRRGSGLTGILLAESFGGCEPSTAIIIQTGLTLFTLYNNHFCFPGGTGVRSNQGDGQALATAINGSSTPVLAVGDFNSSARINPDTLPLLISMSGLTDLWPLVNAAPQGDVIRMLATDGFLQSAVVELYYQDQCFTTSGGPCSDHSPFRAQLFIP